MLVHMVHSRVISRVQEDPSKLREKPTVSHRSMVSSCDLSPLAEWTMSLTCENCL
jgi:hypothetical protein